LIVGTLDVQSFIGKCYHVPKTRTKYGNDVCLEVVYSIL